MQRRENSPQNFLPSLRSTYFCVMNLHVLQCLQLHAHKPIRKCLRIAILPRWQHIMKLTNTGGNLGLKIQNFFHIFKSAYDEKFTFVTLKTLENFKEKISNFIRTIFAQNPPLRLEASKLAV